MTISAAASGKTFLRFALYLLSVCALSAAVPPVVCAAHSQQKPRAVIERVEFVGNRRVQQDTLRARIFTRPGDPYSEEALRRDFQALWNTQFFEDIRLEVEDSPDKADAKIIVFYVQERPIIRRIEYKGNKSITESDILERFKDRKVGLTVESQFDPTKIKRAETVLKELLAEHGRQFAVVRPTYERISATNAVKLVFNMDEGPKVKVGVIAFEGNHAFSSRRIIRSMRHSRPIAIPLLITNIDLFSKTYDRAKLDEDLEIGIRSSLYQNAGYFKVLVKDPILKTVDENRPGIPIPLPLIGGKHGKRTDITIPIEEGQQYRMGSLTFRSADPDQNLFFKPEFLEKVFPLKKGDIFSTEKIRKALENFRKLYGDYGYIDFTAQPLTEPDEATKTINLTLEFDQQKQFFVRRIDFTGNTTTRDKVIRREILLDEGSLFNNRLWELSLLRLNQLSYFDTIKPENAELKRNIKAGTVDINLKLKEKGKQSVSLSGGVSGLAGSFLGFSYETNNFLGLGETLSFSAQAGNRQQNLVFGFTEPYLFDRPISTGFTVFKQKFDYNQQRETSLLVGQSVNINPATAQNYDTNSKGFTIFASYPLRRFSFTRLGVTYGYTRTDINAISQASQLLFSLQNLNNLSGPNALKGLRSSKITPTLSYSTVNSQINPTAGKSFFYGLGLEGGPLGGNIKTITNTFTMEYFHPLQKRRNVFGMRFLTAFGTGFGGLALPPQERFYLGGENDIRGFDFFTVSPYVYIPQSVPRQVLYHDPTILDRSGNPTVHTVTVQSVAFIPTRPGGDFESVGNFEYRIPIAGPVQVALFSDLGTSGLFRTTQLELGAPAVAQFAQQYPNHQTVLKKGDPDLFGNFRISAPIQLAPGTNWKPRSSDGVELVVQLPIVNAPFRIYYAYNPLRLNRTIVPPRGAFFIDPTIYDHLKNIGALQTEVFPAFFGSRDANGNLMPGILDQQVTRLPSGLLEPRSTFRFTVSRTF